MGISRASASWMAERAAITRDSSGRYVIDYIKMPEAIAAVAKELLEIKATGARARAESWFARYDKMPDDLRASLESAKDVPIDFDPMVPFREGVD